MNVNLRYGRGELSIDLPQGLDVTLIRKLKMPIIETPTLAIDEALSNPTNSPSLDELSVGRKTVCILICDITRPVPNGLILKPLIIKLLNQGIRPDQITVLIATGLHRPNEGAELEELIGDPWVLNTVRVENHFARDAAAHVEVGTTSKGNHILLDRRFVLADLKIVTGLVEPHFMAGYSGGRKVIAPGIAHAETITTFHSARYMEDPFSANCVLKGNPLHEDQLEIVEMIGGAFSINVVIDEFRNLSFVNFGEVVSSHLEAVDFIRKYAEVEIPQRFSTVLTSCAGYPLDLTYYQTVKGMVGPIDILKKGGDLIVASNCLEGMGSEEFISAQRRLIEMGPREFLNSILKKTHADIDEWQTEMQLKPMNIGSVHLYSEGLSNEDWALTGVNRVHDLIECIKKSVSRSGDNKIAVIPEGPYVIPVLSSHG
jgi:nickel-dependent lactate racemase